MKDDVIKQVTVVNVRDLLTPHEQSIRDKNTEDCNLYELKEKSRIIQKEITLFDKQVLELARINQVIMNRRERQIKYSGQLQHRINQKIKENYESRNST